MARHAQRIGQLNCIDLTRMLEEQAKRIAELEEHVSVLASAHASTWQAVVELTKHMVDMRKVVFAAPQPTTAD